MYLLANLNVGTIHTNICQILGKNRTYFNSPDPDDFKNLLFMLECVAVSVWWGLSQHMVPQATRTGTSGGSAFPPKSWVPLLTMAPRIKLEVIMTTTRKGGLGGIRNFVPPKNCYIATLLLLHRYIATSLHRYIARYIATCYLHCYILGNNFSIAPFFRTFWFLPVHQQPTMMLLYYYNYNGTAEQFVTPQSTCS